MPGAVKPKRYRGFLFLGAWVIVIFLYSVSVFYSIKFFRQAYEQHLKPSVSVSFENMKQNRKVPFPAFQFCSLPLEPLIPVSCVFEDHPAPGAFHMHKSYSKLETCDFEVSYANAAKQVVCWQVDTTKFNASSPTRFSSVNIKILVKSARDATTHVSHIDPFRDLKGLLVHIFDPNFGAGHTPLPFSGSLLLPAGISSSVAISQTRMDFDVTNSMPSQKQYRVETTFATYPEGAKYDLDGNALDNLMAARFYFGCLSTQLTREVIAYDYNNAFGDSTAVAGFFVGFTFWAGPGLAVWLWSGCGGRSVSVFDL